VNTPTWVSGKYSGGLQFNGTNNYITAPYNADFDFTTNLTVSFWFKPTSTYDGVATVGFVGKASGLVTSENDWWVGSTAGDGAKVKLPGTYGDYVRTTNATWTGGTWYHLAFVVSGTNTARAYVNGVEDTYLGDTDISADPINGTLDNPLEIGAAYLAGTGRAFYAYTIDDFQLYGVALSAAAIDADKNASACVPTPTATVTLTPTPTPTPTP
jgi:hypothetical protein